MNSKIDSGKLKLKPRARIIRTIGDELISNDIIAIIELVKNSYDANSEIVTIEFKGHVSTRDIVDSKTKTIIKTYSIDSGAASSISVSDEGHGMSLDIIKNVWMEPATVFKLINKNLNKSRKYTGEKGIGRFASAKLASSLEIITKTENANEVVAKFNWDDYSADKYLDEVTNEWFERTALKIPKHGTILQMDHLLSDWDEEKLRNLRLELSKLVSPFVENIDFLIDLKLPSEFGELSGVIEPIETLNFPNYSIRGKINSNGIPTELIYFSQQVNIEEDIIDDLILNDFLRIKEPNVGEFSFYFKVWDRDTDALNKLVENLKDVTNENIKLSRVKKDLNDLSGISIYRDNIRVMPYGTKNNDWLRLDLRRVNNPTMRLSNNQIVGYISISLEKNPQFKDQSNREGIIDSAYFEQMKNYIKLVLNRLEIKRYSERPREYENTKPRRGLFDNLNMSDVIDFVETDKYKKDKALHEVIKRKDEVIRHDVNKIKEITASYSRLATFGMLLERLIHDGNQYIAKINLKTSYINKKHQNISGELKEDMRQVDQICSNMAAMIKRFTPFCGRKRGRPQEVILEEIIKNHFKIEESELSKHKIKYILPMSKTITRLDPTEVSEILINLVSNSVYWLDTVNDRERIIEVTVEELHSDDGISIIFSDNGPGIKSDFYQNIFEPYFSTKPDGYGLGLSTVGEIASRYDGEVNLLHDGPQRGATFEIILRKRV